MTKMIHSDKRYDPDWFRADLVNREIPACIPSKTNRKVQIPDDPTLRRQRQKLEDMLGKL